MRSAKEQPPRKGRRFYSIHHRPDGLVDLTLDVHVYPQTLADGTTDYDVSVCVVRGVNPDAFTDFEANIREHYEDWIACGEVMYL